MYFNLVDKKSPILFEDVLAVSNELDTAVHGASNVGKCENWKLSISKMETAHTYTCWNMKCDGFLMCPYAYECVLS